MTTQPANIIADVNRMVRASSQTLRQTGVEPDPKELAHQLSMPIERVHKLLEIAARPFRLHQ